MVSVDTNVLVRLLTGDDKSQAVRAEKVFQNESAIFIPDTVILETAWVLEHAYEYERAAISEAFRKLLGLPNTKVRDGASLHQAIQWFEAGLDFADALHLALSRNTGALYSFDKALCKRAGKLGTSPEALEPR